MSLLSNGLQAVMYAKAPLAQVTDCLVQWGTRVSWGARRSPI